MKNLVTEIPPKSNCVQFIDGDDINRRYLKVHPRKWLRSGLQGWRYKNREQYRSPKILLRQAGIGLCATLDDLGAWCPQSVYIYRVRDSAMQTGYSHEFVLAALLSRTLAYWAFKRFGEVDPAKAHAKMTHERLALLPIPVVNFSDRKHKQIHDKIVDNVRLLLDDSARLGGAEDREVEQMLRLLWGITPDDGAYINGEFADLPESQILNDLFPDGRPMRVATEPIT